MGDVIRTVAGRSLCGIIISVKHFTFDTFIQNGLHFTLSEPDPQYSLVLVYGPPDLGLPEW